MKFLLSQLYEVQYYQRHTLNKTVTNFLGTYNFYTRKVPRLPFNNLYWTEISTITKTLCSQRPQKRYHWEPQLGYILIGEKLKRTKTSKGLFVSPLSCSQDTFWCTHVSKASDRSNKRKWKKETAITKAAFLTIKCSLNQKLNLLSNKNLKMALTSYKTYTTLIY